MGNTTSCCEMGRAGHDHMNTVMISRTFWNSWAFAFLDKNDLEYQFANLYYYSKRYVSLYR